MGDEIQPVSFEVCMHVFLLASPFHLPFLRLPSLIYSHSCATNRNGQLPKIREEVYTPPPQDASPVTLRKKLPPPPLAKKPKRPPSIDGVYRKMNNFRTELVRERLLAYRKDLSIWLGGFLLFV